METTEAGKDERQEDVPPGAAPQPERRHNPAPHRQSTRGGDGAAAGATPKKAHRPSSAKRPRRAGKKPDHGRG